MNSFSWRKWLVDMKQFPEANLWTASTWEIAMRGFLNKFRPKLVRRLAKSESGAMAIEFALVAPMFFLVMGCICETGIMLFSEYAIQAGVQEASRNIRTGQAKTAALSAADFKSKICDLAGIVINCESSLTVYVKPASSFSVLETVLPSYLNVGAKPDGTPNPTSYDIGTSSQALGVIATYDWDFTMPFMSFLGNINSGEKRRLYGIAIFQNEPFP
jgi:Flp pilus assembly protein TadG